MAGEKSSGAGASRSGDAGTTNNSGSTNTAATTGTSDTTTTTGGDSNTNTASNTASNTTELTEEQQREAAAVARQNELNELITAAFEVGWAEERGLIPFYTAADDVVPVASGQAQGGRSGQVPVPPNCRVCYRPLPVMPPCYCPTCHVVN